MCCAGRWILLDCYGKLDLVAWGCLDILQLFVCDWHLSCAPGHWGALDSIFVHPFFWEENMPGFTLFLQGFSLGVQWVAFNKNAVLWVEVPFHNLMLQSHGVYSPDAGRCTRQSSSSLRSIPGIPRNSSLAIVVTIYLSAKLFPRGRNTP